ncbi:ATP-binding protein [Paraburkholderia megapolitana]|uniref:ATP-binding protein n=1 Tax=Paraburkholderia TaxID=1822464 RepID=UPI0027E069BF|nr:ATP-binding protein [Paraburkholderia megapolitana]
MTARKPEAADASAYRTDNGSARPHAGSRVVVMLHRWVHSLSARLWITSVVALAVCLSLLAALVLYAVNNFPQQVIGQHGQLEAVRHLADGLVFDAAGRPVSVQLTDPPAWMFESLPTEVKYRVTDTHGTVLLASPDAGGPPWLNVPRSGHPPTVDEATIDGRPFYVATLQIVHAGTVFRVQTAMSTRLNAISVQVKIKPFPRIVNVTFLAATIIFGLSLTITLRRILRPLRKVSDAAALITPRNLTTRLSTRDIPHEIRPLIDAFNAALDRLENGFTVQQQFLASAAHELQTPLTLIRGQIELQGDIQGREPLLKEIDLMARQVRQLLHLAEVSEAQNFSFGAIDPAEVAQDVLTYLSRKAEALHVGLQLEGAAATLSIWADRSALFILLKNVVENAINVSPAGSTVRMIIDGRSIQIRDEGPGIDDAHLPFLFKRFWRAPSARHDGAGLGLAICREIAIAHGWRIAVNRLGTGTGIVVKFSDDA